MRIFANRYNACCDSWTFGEVLAWDKETNSIKISGLYKIYSNETHWIETTNIRKVYFTNGETLCDKIQNVENFENALYVINNEYTITYKELINTRVFYGTCDGVKINTVNVGNKLFIYVCGNIIKATEIAITKYPKI